MIRLTGVQYIVEMKDEEKFEDGFYFQDETENYVGPYPSLENAQFNLHRYCEECL